MKYEEFVSSLKKKYSVEEFDNVKVVRVTDPKRISVEGVEIEVPNDSAYVFMDNELVSSVTPEEVPLRCFAQNLSDSDYFEVADGRLIRKKI